jgi:predicted RNase H-like HicB family nuclease
MASHKRPDPASYTVAVHCDQSDTAVPTDFGVTVLDLPGTFSAGDTLEEALSNAREAIEVTLEVLSDAGKTIPQPRGIGAILVDASLRETMMGAAIIQLDQAPARPQRAIRIAVSIEESLLQNLDRAAQRRGYTRSGFLAEAARRMIEVV